MKTENKIFYDNFTPGNPYEMEIFSQEDIIETYHNLNKENIVLSAWEHYVSGMTTVAYLNIATGNIEYGNYTTGSYEQRDQHLVPIYSIENNVIGNSLFDWEGDILSTEECEIAEKMIENEEVNDMYEAIEEMEIDFNERFGEFLAYYAEDDIDDEIILENIKTIYNKEK